jgi:hypothetical protein
MYIADAGGATPALPNSSTFDPTATVRPPLVTPEDESSPFMTGAHADVGQKLTETGPRFLNDPKWQFKRNALNTITSNDGHPLSFLVEQGPTGRPQLKRPPSGAHANLIGNETDPAPDYVQAGHRTTKASGAPEFLGVQDAHDNQREGIQEKSGVIYDRSFVDIGDVPVEKRTALRWESEMDPATGQPKLAPGTTAASRPCPGARVITPDETTDMDATTGAATTATTAATSPTDDLPVGASAPDGSPSRVLSGLDGFTSDARSATPALTAPGAASSLIADGKSALPGLLEDAGKAAGPLAVVDTGVELTDAFEADGGTIGTHTEAAASSAAGGWVGAEVGAEGGAEAGAAIGALFGGVGAAPGAVIGGVVGGVVGGIAGSSIGQEIASWF